jgi:hypothetical protein
MDNIIHPLQKQRVFDIHKIIQETSSFSKELGVTFIFHERSYQTHQFLSRYNLEKETEYLCDTNFKIFEFFKIPIKYSTIAEGYLSKNTNLYLTKGRNVLGLISYKNTLPFDFLKKSF